MLNITALYLKLCNFKNGTYLSNKHFGTTHRLTTTYLNCFAKGNALNKVACTVAGTAEVCFGKTVKS